MNAVKQVFNEDRRLAILRFLAEDTAMAGLDGGVNLQNFWQQYRQVMEAGALSPDQFAKWAGAATWVEQTYNAATTAAQQQTAALQAQVSAWQATRQALQATADQLTKTRDSLAAFLHSMQIDTKYSTLSPADNLAARQQTYNDTLAKAKTGDAQANADFQKAAQDLRDFSYDFYGGNADYVRLETGIEADTAGLVSAADMQLSATQEQLGRLDAQISLAQQQLASNSLINDNLARVAGAVEASGSSIVGAINTIGGSGTASTGNATAITDANAAFNAAYQVELGKYMAALGGSSTPFDGAQGFALGGLVTGGIPGVDSVPAWLMPGERVLNNEHSRIVERLAASASPTDTSSLERLVAALLTEVANGNATAAKRLASLENKFAQVSSDLARVVR